MLSDAKVIDAYDKLTAAEHPDPTGFIARAFLKTQLDPAGAYKDYVGAFGVDKRQAKALGYSDDDLFNTDTNFMAALDVDMQNYRAAGEDIDLMYRMSNKSSESSTERFLKKLDIQRQQYQSEFQFQEGRLVALKPPPETRGSDGKVITSFALNKQKSPDDLANQAQAMQLSPENKEVISSAFKKLITLIVKEKPLHHG